MKIIEFDSDKHKERLRELFTEYLLWIIDETNAISGLNIDTERAYTLLERDMQSLDAWMPPNGHILLVELEGQIAGMGIVKWSSNGIAEFKRIYVDPAFRGQGIGERLFNELLELVMNNIECKVIRLESGKFMTSAHKIYQSYGFTDIPPYEGTEVREVLHPYWRFMELWLDM